MSDVLPNFIASEEPGWSALLLVEVAGLPFAIEIDAIREVIEYRKMTRVPLCPPLISGVINVRGSVVPVIDAGLRLELEQRIRYTKYSCIILYEIKDEPLNQGTVLGLLVDCVRSIETINRQEAKPKPAFGCQVDEAFIEQMISVKGEFVPVLSMEHLLAVSLLAERVQASIPPYLMNERRR
ncbi:purine-binding chemotaxis protein CheW [Vibrio sp. 05-20-BW147]|uniref:chemotaxis protein CheW n=1 Tax=Vibrio sp. 05-20-BW147 TaxID=2575834 RepID=UPI0015944F51|nr:chemotaxis protein CheW [Vibrio sp. 05-20-BW147]NVC61812.1 purine-binding chemotaxis protein CheW [Vibrio sp. 05-20-BW147]